MFTSCLKHLSILQGHENILPISLYNRFKVLLFFSFSSSIHLKFVFGMVRRK